MSDIRKDLIHATLNKASLLAIVYTDFHEQFEFKKRTVIDDEILTNDEKTYAIRRLSETYDVDKILNDKGARRFCNNCYKKCLGTLYCEICIRSYLEDNFSNWTSGNDDIDDLIRGFQSEVLAPYMIVEWIPYKNLRDIEYLTKDGLSEVFKAIRIDGRYEEWDSKEEELKRVGTQRVILKRLENVENANKNWFEEAKSHLTINNKWESYVVKSYGLTQDPSSGNYMLVIYEMDVDLRTYLQQNHNKITWKERIQIINNITKALYFIHVEQAIHKDLHSGNILYSEPNKRWLIGDLGFCGPADKPSKSIYGNLPYIAPEIIAGKEATKASDIYSIAMLMWEISSGQPPFVDREYDYNLATNIINGIRPRIVSGAPPEYEDLMKQCWDADPLKRPKIREIRKKIKEIMNLDDQSNSNKSDESIQSKTDDSLELNGTNLEITSTGSRSLLASKIHQFEDFPEPRNATEEEQEAFYGDKTGLNKSNSQSNNSQVILRISRILKARKLPKVFKRNLKNGKNGKNGKNVDAKHEIEVIPLETIETITKSGDIQIEAQPKLQGVSLIQTYLT